MPRKIYVTQYLSFSQGCLSIKCKWHIWYLCIPCYILIFSPMIPGTAMVNNFMQVSTLFAQTVSPFMHRQLFFHSLPGLLRGHSQENKRNTLWILSAQVMMFQKSDKHHGQHSSNGKQKLMHKCFPLLIRSWGGQFQKSFCTFLKRPWTIESPVPTIKSTKKYVPLWNFHLSFFHLPWSPKSVPWGLVANTLSAPKVLTSALLSGREGFRLRLMDTNVCSALLRCVALS